MKRCEVQTTNRLIIVNGFRGFLHLRAGMALFALRRSV